MARSRVHDELRLTYVLLIVAAVIALCCDFVWRPSYAAVSVDAVLTPTELADPQLRDIVYRTHQGLDWRVLFPFHVLAAVMIVWGIAGLWSTRRVREGQ